jgi:type 1 glutamine amidotransferase/dienelactone hydrolase
MEKTPAVRVSLSSALRWALAFAVAIWPASAAHAEDPDRFSKPGPFAVGVRTLILMDTSRHDAYAGGHRTLVTELWYPATPEARDARKTTFSEFFGKHQEAAARFVEHFGGKLEEVNQRFRTVAVRDAPLRPGKYPFLVFSHGNGGVRHQNVFQLDHLASHGYVVASPDHTGNAGVTPLPDRPLPYDRKGRSGAAKDRPLDVSFVITEILALGEREGSWLRGALDAERIGVLGHSFGGYAACRVAESDRRVKAILPMTVAYGRATSLPALVMLAGRDRTMGDGGNHVSRLYWEVCTGPKYLVELRRAGHFSFSDMDRINPSFGDGIGSDRKTGEEFLPIDRSKAWINAFSLAFFERHLRGDAEAERFLTASPDPDEVLVRHASAAPAAPPTPRRVLLVTGEDVPAHDWRSTAPVVRDVLEAQGGFEVRVCEDPAILATSAIERYDLVVLHFRNAPPGPADAAALPWRREAVENLAAFVRRGKGLAALHFAVNSFQGDDAFAALLGRVWVGRRGGQRVSGHGPRGRFTVSVAKPEHAVTSGIAAFEADDEIYSRLAGEAAIDVLLDAHSEWSGQREPIAWTRSGPAPADGVEEGRVFVTVLGHDVRAMENPAFRRLLVQGAQWAAQ